MEALYAFEKSIFVLLLALVSNEQVDMRIIL
jgi:hypothetical protein